MMSGHLFKNMKEQPIVQKGMNYAITWRCQIYAIFDKFWDIVDENWMFLFFFWCTVPIGGGPLQNYN